jgi:hypothetical protein
VSLVAAVDASAIDPWSVKLSALNIFVRGNVQVACRDQLLSQSSQRRTNELLQIAAPGDTLRACKTRPLSCGLGVSDCALLRRGSNLGILVQSEHLTPWSCTRQGTVVLGWHASTDRAVSCYMAHSSTLVALLGLLVTGSIMEALNAVGARE